MVWLFGLAEDFVSRLKFLFWGSLMVYCPDYVSEGPESMVPKTTLASMVVGTRCNFACLPFMVRGMLFCRCIAKIDEGTVYVQRIFIQFRDCIFEI